MLYTAHKRYEEAEPLLERVLTIDERQRQPEEERVAADLSRLIEVETALGKHEEAAAHYERLIPMVERVLGAQNPELIPVLERYADALEATGHAKQAQTLRGRAAAIGKKSR
jgi:tetratricopeptide (TPR) repeat protein